MRTWNLIRRFPAFTLIELLLVIAIIGLLVSLLLPALNRGHHKVREIQCTSNLRQAGLGFLSFAHGHDDRFPIQVSTNQGGSSEFLDAGNAIRGSFFFSYKHFLPLAAEVETPKILVCPTDRRLPATNFASLSNSNLSYFSAAHPVFGDSASPLAGDRNLEPASNTLARVGPRRALRWNGEMHQNRGNVLFADGHVSQSLDFFSQSNHPGASLTSLILPDVPPPAIEPTLTQTPAGGGGGGGGGGGSAPAIAGGNLRVSFPARNPDFLTNAGTVTNLQITSGPRDTPRSAFVVPGPRGQDTPLPIPNFPSAESARTNTAAPAAPTPSPEKTDEQQVQQAHNDLVQGGRQLATKAARTTYVLPWWLIIALLLLALWLLKRAHDRTPRKSKPRTQAPSFFFSKER